MDLDHTSTCEFVFVFHISFLSLFLNFQAQTWCAVTRPEFDKMLITTDVHSPNEFRVIGTISNMQEFSHDFSCKSGSQMNPIKKCEVW